MAHRLLVGESESIATKLIGVKMLPDLANLHLRYRLAANTIYASSIPDDLVNIIKNHLNWFNTATEMSIRTRAGMQASVQFIEAKDTPDQYYWHYRSYFYGDESRPMPNNDLPFMVSQEAFDEVTDLEVKIKKLMNEIHDVHRNIVAKIKGRSVKVVCEGWPEVKEIVEGMTFTSSSPSTALSIAPALNEKLGLSK